MTKTNYIILISIAGLLLQGCQPKQSTANEGSIHTPDDKTGREVTPTVQVVHPDKRSFQGDFTLTGTAMPNKTVTVFALEAGQINQLMVDIGQWVNKGQTIATLKNPEITRGYEVAKVETDYAQKDYERLAGMNSSTPDLISQREVEQAEAKYKMKKAQLDAISNRAVYLKVKAPFSGIVSRRYVDVGAMVQNALTTGSATPIVDIIDAGTIRLTLYLPEADVAYVSKETEATITFPELGGKVYKGHVARTSGALDPQTKNMTVEIDLPNKNRIIKSGMFARVHFILETQKAVISLPQEALVLKNDATYVYVVKEDVAHLMEIKKGLQDKNNFQVISGIGEDDLVVIKGKNTIADGVRVHIVK